MSARMAVLLLTVCLLVSTCIVAQDAAVITNGLPQIAEELCQNDWNLWYIPGGPEWTVYPTDYWQPKWIDFSEYPSLQQVKSNVIASRNQCVLG